MYQDRKNRAGGCIDFKARVGVYIYKADCGLGHVVCCCVLMVEGNGQRNK